MRLTALSNINSGQFVAGDTLDLPDAEALALIEAGAAEALDASEPTEPTTPEASVADVPLVPTPAVSESSPTEPVLPPVAQPPAPEQTAGQPSATQIADTLAALQEPPAAPSPSQTS